jgi:hypothetical protein
VRLARINLARVLFKLARGFENVALALMTLESCTRLARPSDTLPAADLF